MVNINKYIKALLHPAGGHQGSHKAHQAGNQGIHYTVRFLVIHCAPDISRSLFCVYVVKDTP